MALYDSTWSNKKQKKDEIVHQINAGLAVREIDLSVQACTEIPTKKLEPEKVLALHEQIVAEIFQQAGITQKQAPLVWESMAEAIMLRKMLEMTELEQHERWTIVLGHMNQIIRLQEQSYSHVSLPADDLGFIIAALLFRRLQLPDQDATKVKRFIEIVGNQNVIQWLPVAIEVSNLKPKLRSPFVIEIDEGLKERQIKREMTVGGCVVVVTTKSPAVNIYESDIREALRTMDIHFSHLEMRIKTPVLTDHNEESINPGCDTTRAELPAPEPVPAADRREAQPHREFFERYKLLWKGSLQEHGNISGSLRGLVYQDCTDEQIFYLEETEKDFLAERMR